MPIVEFSNLNQYGNLRTRRFYQEKSNFGINPKGLGSLVSFSLFRYDYKHSIIPPSLTTLNGKRYIVPTFQEVLPGTTLDDINWIRPKQKKILESKVVTKITISGSGLGKYTTKYYPESEKYHCSCPGYWRSKGNCKHVKEMKNN